MDDLLIKTNTVAAPKTTDSANLTTLAGLAISFQDLLQKAGLRIESGLHAIADRAGITAGAERSQPANPSDDYRRQADDSKDRADARDRADANPADSSRARQADRQDDHGRDQGAERRDTHADGRDKDRGQDNADGRTADKGDKGAADREAPAADDRGSDQKSAAADGKANKTNDKSKPSEGETNNTATEQTGAEKGATANPGVDAAVAQAAVAAAVLNPLLAGLLGKGETQSAGDGPVKTTAVAAVTGVENAAQTALENVTVVTPVSTGKESGPQNNHHGQAQAFVNANAHAKTAAADPAAVNVDTDGEVPVTPADMQAASLAKMIGDGNRAQVNVSVSNEAQTLVSRPTATLSANTLLSGDSQGQASSAQTTNTHVQAANPNPTAAAQQTQAGQAQTQGGQNAQAQVGAQAGGDAKSLVQAASTSGNAGGTAHSGGGEAVTQTGGGNATGAQQTQQAQQQQAANQAAKSEQPARSSHSVVEQVFVKITKALNAGNDKITIQLRPANMGRVEVKMELTHDHRLIAVVTADNKDTLALLQKDARELQRALADAGLHTGDGDLNFNLRGETGRDTEGDGKSAGKLFNEEPGADAEEAAMKDALFAPRDGVYVNGRIDVRA